jgi:hypothetical protein
MSVVTSLAGHLIIGLLNGSPMDDFHMEDTYVGIKLR